MGDALHSAFAWAFKYPLEMFQDGRLELGAGSWIAYAGAVLAAALLVPSVLRYINASTALGAAGRTLLYTLRTLAFAALLFALFSPELVLTTAASERGVVGLLVDNSLSMTIADEAEGSTRAERIAGVLGEAGAIADLRRSFDVRLFKFGAKTQGLNSLEELDFSDSATRLGEALDQAREALSGLPVAALVAVTDGAHNTDLSLDAALLSLQAADLPLHTLGVGRSEHAADIEIAPVAVPRSVLKGTAIAVDVEISAPGFAGSQFPLTVEDEGQILTQQDVNIPEGESSAQLRVQFTLDETGPRRLRFRIPAHAGETLTENNARSVLVHVQKEPARILYFEGEPRFEVKFIRRALEDDENITLVTLIRTAENKFYRVGVEQKDELVDGFPSDRETLFKYQGLIIGSVEAGYFSAEQLQMIADFAALRGGGVLFLGGRNALAEGGYAGTPVEDVAAVVLGAQEQRFARDVAIEPTAAGLRHPVLNLGITDAETGPLERWQTLPPLRMVNAIREAKPGAEVWMRANDGQSLVVLAAQRYGRGRSAVFAVQNAWRWQMHENIALDDMTHETLWQQLLRWLVQDSAERIHTNVAERAAPGQAIEVAAVVRDAAFEPTAGMRAQVRVESPSGYQHTIELNSNPYLQVGKQETTFVPDEQGVYTLDIATVDEAGVADAEFSTKTYVAVSEQAHEFHGATLRERLLTRISTQTGGSYRPLSQASELRQAIAPRLGGSEEIERLPLWNMPALLMVLALLLAIEWFYRRARGLA